MKIKPEHYKLMAEALAPLILNTAVRQSYTAAGYSDMRFRWDVLRASTIEGVRGITWIGDNLYPYMNDDHIDTALRHIMTHGVFKHHD